MRRRRPLEVGWLCSVRGERGRRGRRWLAWRRQESAGSSGPWLDLGCLKRGEVREKKKEEEMRKTEVNQTSGRKKEETWKRKKRREKEKKKKGKGKVERRRKRKEKERKGGYADPVVKSSVAHEWPRRSCSVAF